ncbi:phasin family protein [Massilia horti]|nr:phasin family protein [Massilia horti]
MTSLPEQFSAARKTQVELQFDFFRAVTSQAFDSAGKLIALNLNTSRAAVERSTKTIGRLFSITDPRDLFALGLQPQEQFQNMVAYGRELINIATAASIAVPRAAAPAPVRTEMQAQPESAPAAVFPEEAASGQFAKTSAKPEAANADEPVATITEAVSKVVPKAEVAEHPAAAPLMVSPQHEIALPSIAPEQTPAPVRRTKQAASAKTSRRK